MTEPGYAIVRDAEISADGSRILTASTDGVSRIWDAETQRLLISLAVHSGRIFSASFSSAPCGGSGRDLQLGWQPQALALAAVLSSGIDSRDAGKLPTRASFSRKPQRDRDGRKRGVARIWDASSHSQLEALGRPGGAALQSPPSAPTESSR